MCWSTEVSWAFACFDAICVAFLLVQHYGLTAPDKRAPATPLYAVFMSLIATQEFGQFMIWRRGHTMPDDLEYCRSFWDVFWAFVTFGAAWSAPLPFVLDMPNSAERRCAATLWMAMIGTVLVCVWLSDHWCVHEGPNHHQVWICAAAHDVGGLPLYAGVVLGYVTSGLWALRYAQSVPPHEKFWLVNIAVANGVVAYGIYGWTLEGCSVWCWSASCGGIYLCTKDVFFPPPSHNKKSPQEDSPEATKEEDNNPETVPILEAMDSL